MDAHALRTPPDPQKILGAAAAAFQSGRTAEAKAILYALLEEAPPGMPRLGALRLLSRILRQDRDFDAARAAALEALALTDALPAWRGAALEGLALIESHAGNLRQAGDWFVQSADAELAAGNAAAMGMALNNYALMLFENGIDGAEPLLRRALENLPPGTTEYAACADNMGTELERQGRHAEAVKWCEQATTAFRDLDDPWHLFVALRNLGRHQLKAGRFEESGRTFTEAHDLILPFRRAQVDREHYTTFAEIAARLEAGADQQHVDFVQQARMYAGVAYEQARFDDALQAYTSVLPGLQQLGWWHLVARFEHQIALTLTELGEPQQAIPHAARARAIARDLGDAEGESMALTGLYSLRHLIGEDGLDLLAQARALEIDDGGVLAMLLANQCADAHAYELALRYSEEALSHELDDLFAHRRAMRLVNHFRLLTQMGEDATQTLAELRTLVTTKLAEDPRGVRLLASVEVRQAFADGDRSESTLAGLLEECRAYERLRDDLAGAPRSGLSGRVDPPFEEAAEVALALDRPALALRLVQLGKARTTLEALGVPTPGLDDPPPALEGRGVELFVSGDRGIVAFVLDGETLTTRETPPPDWRTLDRLTDAADSERGDGAVAQALDAVLAESGFTALNGLLTTLDPVWLAPHRSLHQAPLQLAGAWTVIPALPAAAALPPRRPAPTRAAYTVVGDPDGTLPFARAEARIVAEDDARLAIGADATIDWLRAACTRDDLAVLHIACHGSFDRGRPDRSGLSLAVKRGEAFAGTTGTERLTAEAIAGLPLHGVLVTLSACSSALEAMHEGDEPTGVVSALMRAGASAVIAAQWPIPDLSAMLMMAAFHDALFAARGPVKLRALLAQAGADLRALTATGLAERGFALARRAQAHGAPEDEVVGIAARCLQAARYASGERTDLIDAPLAALESLTPQSTVQPFAHPLHWGAFAVIGRDTIQGERAHAEVRRPA